MPRSVQRLGSLVRAEFTVYDGADAPVIGLADGAFTKLLSLNGAPDATPVAVAEIGGGRYEATFTPAFSGDWYLLVRQATFNPRGWDENFDVTVDGVYVINDIFDKADGVETGYTVRQSLRLMAAVLCGKVSGAPGTPVFRNMPDTANRVSATDTPAGNRTVVTLTP